MNFKRINVTDARRLMLESTASESTRQLQIVDIRDDEAYGLGHIANATHLHNANLQEFINSADFDAPLLVYCYHGHTSQSVAAYFSEQGFSEAYSLDGGYEAWEQG